MSWDLKTVYTNFCIYFQGKSLSLSQDFLVISHSTRTLENLVYSKKRKSTGPSEAAPLHMRCLRAKLLISFLTLWTPCLAQRFLGQPGSESSTQRASNADLSVESALSFPFCRREERGCEQSHEARVACPRLQSTSSRAELRTPSHLIIVSVFPACSKSSMYTPQWRQDPNVWQTVEGAPHIWLKYKPTLCNSLKPRQTSS